MKYERLFAFGWALGLLVLAGCDTGAPRSGAGQQVQENPCFQGGAPFVARVEFSEPFVRAGSTFTITGGNFDPVLENNEVFMSAGNREVKALIFDVRVDASTSGGCAQNSQLRGIVPSGVSSGTIELFVNGQSAAGAAYDADPVLYGHTLGVSGTEEFLLIDPVGAFLDGRSRVNIYGLNFNDVREVVVSDARGNTTRIAPNSFIRNPGGGQFQTGVVPTGLDQFGFNLRDANNDVRLPFSGARDNLGVQVRGSSGRLSNRIEVAVTRDPDPGPQEIGAVINGVRVPTGVVTGAVRIDYTMYERQIDASWNVRVEFEVEGVTDQSGQSWFPAKPLVNDPENDGNTGILAGPILRPSAGRLLPGGGATRTFIWDACTDPIFRAINESVTGGIASGRDWVIRFRLRPIPEQPQARTFYPTNPPHTVETPPILYVDLADRPAENVAAQRQAEFVESFDNLARLDSQATTASWGPPNNPGLLVATLEGAEESFGEGRAVVRLERLDDSNLPQDERIDTEFFVINTDTRPLRIDRFVIRADADATQELLPVPFLDADGNALPPTEANPGEALGEYHFASLEVAEDVTVVAVGSRPLVIRLSGPDGEATAPGVVTFRMAGTIDLSGFPGEAGEATFGASGPGGAGGGAGGSGGEISVDPNRPLVTNFVAATAGAAGGGGGGETPAAVHFDTTRPQASLFPGGAGGGGGHRLAGADGGLRSNPIPEYHPPRVGRGGPPRGTLSLFPLTGGSGGGGGGASLSRFSNQQQGLQMITAAGGGGGGGGGAFKLVCRGTAEITGRILANGGAGGGAIRPPGAVGSVSTGGPGGGGSGGAILIRAVGPILVSDCENLQVNGGAGGESESRTQDPGGAGAPGYVRFESESGGSTFCGALEASATLAAVLNNSARTVTIPVDSTAGFPGGGTLVIHEEEVEYTIKKPGAFEGATRGVNGTAIVSHNAGARVLLKGPVQPAGAGALAGGGPVESPDPIAFGLGRDGVLHLRFIPSVDPISGRELVDPDTGAARSVWTFDTETSVLTDPTGQLVLQASAAKTLPGLLDLTQLMIDRGVELRARGANPFQLSVRDVADIAGTIDVSGFPGGPLRFSAPGANPDPGLGGGGGPGGGSGGRGGRIDFLDGDLDNKNPANTLPVDGERGYLPRRAAAFDRTDAVGAGSADLLVPPEATGARGGQSLPGLGCGDCVVTAGGGGGGGNLLGGNPGLVGEGNLLQYPDLGGEGGSPFGLPSLRFLGDLLLVGGTGGAGGGSVPHTSAAYQNARILGRFVWRGRERDALGRVREFGVAKYAPGTGGGGGGGVFYLRAANLSLAATGRILARGGDAFQSIDLGGNGGGGAGGTVLLQVTNSFSVGQGAVIDVRGGRANRLPPENVEGIPLYEGNVRRASLDVEPSESGASFGGPGGDGAPGRIRIEVPAGSALAAAGANENVSSGRFSSSRIESFASSTIERLGLGPGRVAGAHGMVLGVPVIRIDTLRQGSGAGVTVLWEGMGESLDVHASPGSRVQSVEDPALLSETQFVRFSAYFHSDSRRRAVRAIQELRLPYSLACEPVSP